MKSYTSRCLIVTIVVLFLCNMQQVKAQGPNSPEAASFEPVDATDMVNLVTGDFTYVLPLLNVPSPEGGYPIALSYHAGIAMDQEASWVGLGWSLNPGAINRSVNGYPDDYNNSLLEEYFYDEGETISVYSLSLGFGTEGLSVGLGFSWGSHKSFGGTVSIGISPVGTDGVGTRFGVSAGENGVGINAGYTFKGGLSFGMGVNADGTISASIDNNSAGFSVSSNGSVGVRGNSKSGNGNIVSTGITFSSNGIGINGGVTNKTGNTVDGGVGIGLSLQFENTMSMGDYTAKTSGWMIPIMLPTKIGVFSLSFGKQKLKYWLGKKESNYVTGPISFSEGVFNKLTYEVECTLQGQTSDEGVSCGYLVTASLSEAEDYAEANQGFDPTGESCVCSINTIDSKKAFMDIYEVPLSVDNFANSTQMNFDNAAFPNYDNYSVQAQGLSGGMSSHIFENGNLFGLAGKENNQGYSLSYGLDGSSTTIPDHTKFDSKPHFYFDNEISTYLGFTDVNEASFYFSQGNTNSILSYYDDFNDPVERNAKPRRRNATYIDYYTVKDLRDGYAIAKSQGYLTPNPDTGFDVNAHFLPEDGIAAFKVTSADGKTYHYSLPVYNHEMVVRTYGVIPQRNQEAQGYQEKRQLEPYATHWLLTAVTGPDYVDTNNNGFADLGDYGFWTAFEYGKWSDAFAWKTPYGKDYFENDENADIKTRIEGRKQVYYLDQIKTRTHTALFVKNERVDALSHEWAYRSVRHIDNQEQGSTYFNSDEALRFTIPSQKSLQLNKIILVKNLGEDSGINKVSGASNAASVDVEFNDSSKPVHTSWYNLKDNVVDVGDMGLADLENRAIKIIDFNYNYTLAKGSPNTPPSFGRLSLTSVNFKGKGGENVLPPYNFSYTDPNHRFHVDEKDNFGYVENKNHVWSIESITTPTGGVISPLYEQHEFSEVLDRKAWAKKDRYYSSSLYEREPSWYDVAWYEDGDRSEIRLRFLEEANSFQYPISVGDQFEIDFEIACEYDHDFSNPNPVKEYHGTGTVTEVGYFIIIIPDNPLQINRPNSLSCLRNGISNMYKIQIEQKATHAPTFNGGGAKTTGIKIADGSGNEYLTKYTYGEDSNNLGFISYVPNSAEVAGEMPYSSELPAPKVMYEYVTMESFGTDNKSYGKTQYKFKVLKEKDPNSIKFGDLYSLVTYNSNTHYNASADKEVEINSYQVHDNLASLGQLLEVSTFNGKGQLLSKIENSYYSPSNPTPGNVGVTKEAFQSYKEVDYTNNTLHKDKWLINSSSRISYPSLLKSSTEYKGSFSYTSQFGALDEVTGQALEVLNYNSKGHKFKTKTVPAYTIPQYGLGSYSMASKVDNITNKNMLSQTAASYAYLIDPLTGEDKVAGASITTWNNNWSYKNYDGSSVTPTHNNEKVWRKHKTYTWKGTIHPDGTLNNFNTTNDDGFNWGIGATQSHTQWEQLSEVTLYDRFSSPIESKDINNNYVSNKKGDKQSKVIAVSNAKYNDTYYSGAEYLEGSGAYFEGGVNATQQSTDAHTGSYSAVINQGSRGFEVSVPTDNSRTGLVRQRFKVSVWIKKGQEESARIYNNGSTLDFQTSEQATAGNWVLLNGYITIPEAGATVAITSSEGSILADDFRLHPASSSMTSYVYNEWDELSYIIGANGLATHYKYTLAGELEEVWTEVIDHETPFIPGGFKRISKYKKHYKNQ